MTRRRTHRPERGPQAAAGAAFLDGRSRAVRRVMEQVLHIASTHVPVLIEGETGTGKGRVALAVHRNSPRGTGPFVRLDCLALPPTLIEAELFGEDRASGPGTAPRRGRLESADQGTLYLDHVGGAPPPVQARLLRFLQDRAFERVGGAEILRSDVRLVAASDGDLAAEVRAGRFREDLYDRLSVVRVLLPPLRERREDVPFLVRAFLDELNRARRRRITGLTPGALERLTRHDWPGNVRELGEVLEGMMVVAQGRRALDLSDLPEAFRRGGAEPDRLDIAVGTTVEGAERALIAATLRHTGYDKARTAAMLGIGLRTLYRKVKQYALLPPEPRRRSQAGARRPARRADQGQQRPKGPLPSGR